jgi:hypothetical protein
MYSTGNVLYCREQGRTEGGVPGCSPSQTPQNRNIKNADFVDIVMSKFYVIYPSAEISNGNWLMNSTLEFLKIN